MGKKISGWMKANAKFRPLCAKALNIKLFKKLTPTQKKRVNSCIARKARAAGMKVEIPDPQKGRLWVPWK